MKDRTHRTPEEKQEAIAKVDAARKEGLTADKACEKAGVNYSTYMGWLSRKAPKGKKKRKNKKVVVVQELVPMNKTEHHHGPSGGERPSLAEAAALLAHMNAVSVRTLMQGVA